MDDKVHGHDRRVDEPADGDVKERRDEWDWEKDVDAIGDADVRRIEGTDA